MMQRLRSRPQAEGLNRQEEIEKEEEGGEGGG